MSARRVSFQLFPIAKEAGLALSVSGVFLRNLLWLSGHSQNPLSSSDHHHPGQYSSALGVDLHPETHAIHHLLAVTPVRSIHRMMCLHFDCTRHGQSFLRLTNFVAGRNCATVFSVQRLHGFREVVPRALWHRKSINFQINTQGRLLIEGHKRELVKDLYIVQKAVIFNNKPNTATKTTQKQTKTNPQKRSDWQPVHWQIHARGDNIVSSHHMAANKQKRGETTTNTRPYSQVRSNTAPCGNQGSPQPGSPRSQGAS